MTTVPRDASWDTGARMTVLALEASLPKAVRTRPPIWRLAQRDRSELSSEDLVGILADLPKPVVCVAAAGESSVDLSCEHVTTDNDFDYYARALAARSSLMVEGIRRQYGVADDEDVILFRSRYTGASMFVSLDDLKVWIRDFYLRSGATIVRDPDEPERQGGAAVVVELGSSETIRGEIEFHQSE